MGVLEGRVAVVTGAGRGIGREIAICLAAEGASVVVNDIGSSLDGKEAAAVTGEEPGSGASLGADPASEVCQVIEEAGGKALPSYESVSDFEAARRMVAGAVEGFGRIDILVNNAGIVRDRTLLKMTEADYDAVVAVHQKGTFNCAHHAAAFMREAGYGRIVNITSSAGLRGNFGQTNYAAAKAAIMGMTFVWALELGRYGITVNAVAPAGITRMTAGLSTGGSQGTGGAGEAEGTDRASGAGAGVPSVPADQDPALNAPLVAFLASEEAGYVNGQVLGRTGFAYTIFQTPKQVAGMWREGGWTVAEVGEHFHDVLGQYLQPVGMPAHPLLGRGPASA